MDEVASAFSIDRQELKGIYEKRVNDWNDFFEKVSTFFDAYIIGARRFF